MQISINKEKLKQISDSACAILTLIRIASKSCEIDPTDMEYALTGVVKLAQAHNDSLLDYIVDEENDNDSSK